MVMVTIALVMAVIVTNIYAKKESPERAPNWCVAVVSRIYPNYFSSDNDTGSRMTKGNRKRKNETSNATCDNQLLRSFSITSAHSLEKVTTCNWAAQKPEVVIETDNEIWQHCVDSAGDGEKPSVEVINSGSGYQSGHNDSEDIKPDVNEVIVDRKRLPDKYNRRRFETEWKLIAKFTDRVFFWVFLVLSIIVQVTLFLQMVPLSSRQ